MDNNVKIALVQFQSKLNCPDENMEKACGMIAQAASQGAKIVCFPELFSTGYNLDIVGPKLPETAERLDGPRIAKLCQAAKENGCYVIAPVATEREVKGVYFNSAVLIDDEGHVVGCYDKHHLYSLERFHFRMGNDIPVFDTKYGKIGIMICYDAGFPEVARLLMLQGAEVIFMPSAWRVQDKDIWDINVAQRALENLCYVAAVNRFGQEVETYLFGGTKVANSRGTTVAECTGEKEEIVYADLDLASTAKNRQEIDYLKDRRPDSYQLIAKKL